MIVSKLACPFVELVFDDAPFIILALHVSASSDRSSPDPFSVSFSQSVAMCASNQFLHGRKQIRVLPFNMSVMGEGMSEPNACLTSWHRVATFRPESVHWSGVKALSDLPAGVCIPRHTGTSIP